MIHSLLAREPIVLSRRQWLALCPLTWGAQSLIIFRDRHTQQILEVCLPNRSFSFLVVSSAPLSFQNTTTSFFPVLFLIHTCHVLPHLSHHWSVTCYSNISAFCGSLDAAPKIFIDFLMNQCRLTMELIGSSKITSSPLLQYQEQFFHV